MADAEAAGRPPLDWRRLLPLALAVGVGPAVGRDVAAGLQDAWGFWPAKLAGVGAAAAGALAAYGAVWLVVHLRRRPAGAASGTPADQSGAAGG